MCVVNLGDCTCSCHYMEGVVHMMPCCETCSECGKQVTWLEGHIREHEAQMQSEQE